MGNPGELGTDPEASPHDALLVIVPHTTALRGNRWELSIPKAFLRPGAFHLLRIQSISLARLERELGPLTAEEFLRVKASLTHLFELIPFA